jgi:surface polysaccharide O-acyltransferase-like enzyme
MSSYLYFLNTDGSLAGFIAKMKKRARTLLIPFCFGHCQGLPFIWLCKHSADGQILLKGHIVDFTARQWLQTIFINPIPYQLWFVRDLMVLIILSPLLYQGIKHYWRLLLALAFIGWILVPDVWQNSSEALLFFIVGASLSVHQPQRIENNYARFSIIWMFLDAACPAQNCAAICQCAAKLIFGIFKLSVLVGVFACWSFYDRLFRDTQNTNKALLKLSAFTFFIYASHEPVLTVFKKVLFVILGETVMGHLKFTSPRPYSPYCFASSWAIV